MTGRVWLNLFAFTCIIGGMFVLNQIKDREIDKENNKLFLLADGYISLAGAVIETVIVYGAGLGIGFFLFGFQNGLMLTALAILGGYLYNYEPFNWKNKPFLGLLTNVLGGFTMFGAGWTLLADVSLQTIYSAIPYLAGFAAVTLLTMVPDEAGDTVHHKETFIVKFGLNPTIYTATGFILIAAIGGALNGDPLILGAAVLSLPWYIYASVKPGVESSLGATRFSALFLGLAISTKFPVYLLLLAATFFLARFYYRKRFGLNYPALNMDKG